MADQEVSTTDDRLEVVIVRETKRRRQVLRPLGGGSTVVSSPDGGHRSGRGDVRAALRPWQLVVQDEGDDDAA